jgi:CRP/FNR family cyclic AMP-dependent transcriptional regulator
LASLSPHERASVLAATRRRAFGKGEIVFHEGDPGDALHLVESGHLAVRVGTPDGEQVTLNVLRPGDIVGELTLLDDRITGHRSATVVALEPCTTRVVSASAFRDLCRQHPGVQAFVIAALARRVRELSSLLLESLHLGLDRRVYRRLLELADVYGPARGPTVIPLTQDQLADLVGGTRPSVNQVLQRLQTQGLIELHRGRIGVLDPDALRRMAG